MLKNLKKLFVCIFILIFSSVCFLSTLSASATDFLPEQVDLEERIFSYTSVIDLDNPSLKDYSSICKNLYRLIISQDDYEKMYDILNDIAFHLFGRSLSEPLRLEHFEKNNFIFLYNKAIKHILPLEDTFYEDDLDLFDAILVYSCISKRDDITDVEKSLLEITLILRSIHPETLSFFRED